MPLTRYQIRNEYSLADPELYLAADKDDPEAILEGVAMSGLVGVLRQLGDLAEFAAEIFHDLHEEVMATAARGHGLVARVQQLEAEVPLVEKAFMSQTNPSSLYYNAGVDWHPNLRMDQNLITQGDLPRFVMDSYEECRGPPRLFILDKFDVAGAGACLKRYTNPSFFKVEAASSGTPNLEIQRDKKFRKVKRKGARGRNGEISEILPTSNVKLHQLLLEERVEDVSNDPARLVKLKKRQLNESPLDSQTRKNMQKLLRSPSSDPNGFREISMNLHPFMSSSYSIESEPEMHDIQTVGFSTESLECTTSRSVSPIAQETSPEHEISSRLHITIHEKELTVDRECKVEASVNWYPSDDVLSETDNFMDALNTLESEIETDTECRTKNNVENLGTDSDANEIDNQLQAQLSDFQSIDFSSPSDDENISFKEGLSSSSYSDLSSLVEITRLDDDGADGVLSSIENILVKSLVTSDEILETSYHEHSFKSLVTSDETLETNYHEHPISNGTCSEVVEVPSASDECGERSNISDCANLNNKLLPVDYEASSREVLSETFSVGDALDTGLLISDRNRTNTGDVSHARDNDLNVSFLKTIVLTESHPVDDLDYQDSKTSTDSLLHPSSNSDLALDKYSKEFHLNVVPETGNSDVDCHKISLFETSTTENDVDNVIKTDYIDDASEKNIIDGNIGNFLPAYTAHFSDDENPDNLVSKVVALSAPLVNSEEPSLMIDATQSNSVPKQIISERKTEFLTHDINSSEVGDLPSVERAYIEEGVHTNNYETIDEFNNSKEGMESALGSSQVSFEYSSDRRPEDQVEKDNKVIETIRGETEDMMAPVTAAYIDNGTDTHSKSHEIRWFSTRKSKDMQETLSTSEDSHEKELEIHDSCSANCSIESKALEKVNPPAVDQEKEDLKPLEVLPNDHSNSEPLNYAPDPCSNVQCTSTLPCDDVTTSSASSKQYIQQVENLSDVTSGSPQIGNDYNNHFVQDCTATTISSKQVEQDIGLESPLLTQLSDYSKSEASLPTGYLSDSVIPFEKELELQSDDADVEGVHADKIIPKLLSPCSEQNPDPNDLPQKICSSSKHGSSEQAMPPLLAVFPSMGMFPQASEVCLEESPPLPPLPPMQWRMGKLPNISPVSTAPSYHEHRLGSYSPIHSSTDTENAELSFLVASPSEIQQFQNPFLSGSDVKDEKSQEHRLDSYPPVLSYTDTENTQIDFLASSSEIQQSQNPFLSGSDVKDENFQHYSKQLQNPLMISDADNQQNSMSVLDPTESMIPFLNLLETPKMPENGFRSFEETPATSHTPVLLPKNLILAQNHHTLENQVEENTGEKVDHSTEFPVSPVIEDQQHQLGWQMQVPGDLAWLKYSFGLTTAYENGKKNDATSAKIPRPRNPLIDAVVAHDKSKLRKVTERPRSSIEPNPDERDSMLAQIRTKSFNLKPAVLTRPSIQGPKTNLKVTAILEKAKAIRQAFAGSDEDDDDNWSDD